MYTSLRTIQPGHLNPCIICWLKDGAILLLLHGFSQVTSIHNELVQHGLSYMSKCLHADLWMTMVRSLQERLLGDENRFYKLQIRFQPV